MSEERSLTVPSCAQGGKLSYAIFTLARAHRSYVAELLRELGLHPGQELLLMQLLDRDGQTQSELLDSVGLDHSTVSKSLGRMEEAGLVTRVPNETDKRVLRVHLTRKGLAMKSKIAAMWTTLERTTVANLDASAIRWFISLATTVQRSLVNRDSVTEA